MHYPVMSEKHVADSWQVSLKTLRRWRLDGEGPVWHKLSRHVRYHEANVLEFEHSSAQHLMTMLGINAFTPPKQEDPSDPVQPVGSENDKFDTIVVPAREEGFKQRFLNENCWFAVRINAKHISKLKFIAAYQVAPVAAITQIAEVEAILPYNDTGKYMIKFKGPATAIVPIPRPENSEVNMQSSRYALREKLLAAKNLDEVWS
ncbi:MAG: helix-turn-helix domain-containing protein [Pseudomonadota bacterium]